MTTDPTVFHLHPQLAADTAMLGDWPLCRVLLMDEARYPWVILVPRRSGTREIHELGEADQQQLLSESLTLSRVLMDCFSGHKLNVAALGNVVAQLHIHHVVRDPDDAAWPGPVWGRFAVRRYEAEVLARRCELLRERLGAVIRWVS